MAVRGQVMKLFVDILLKCCHNIQENSIGVVIIDVGAK